MGTTTQRPVTEHDRRAAVQAAYVYLDRAGYQPHYGTLDRIADECFPSKGSFTSYWQRIAARWVDGRDAL